MNCNAMRYATICAYPGEKWKKKVLSMSDEQLLAVYKSLQKQGKVK